MGTNSLDKNKPYAEIWGGTVPAKYEQEGRYYDNQGRQVDLKPEHYDADPGTTRKADAPVVVLGANERNVPGGGVVTNPPDSGAQAAGTTQQPGGTRDNTALSLGTDIARQQAGQPAAGSVVVGIGGAEGMTGTTGQQAGDSGQGDARAAVAERRSENLLKAMTTLERGQNELIPELPDHDVELLDAMLEVENRGKKRVKVIDAIEQELLAKKSQEDPGSAGGDQVGRQLGG